MIATYSNIINLLDQIKNPLQISVPFPFFFKVHWKYISSILNISIPTFVLAIWCNDWNTFPIIQQGFIFSGQKKKKPYKY